MPQSIHFISIGGSAMHNLALALQQQGHIITGSDERIHEPSRTRLQQRGLLPDEVGWFPEKIHSGLDAVIVGMHARNDNPELVKALALGLNVYSYPEFIYQQSQQKQRIVITGSHGKTTITAIILHVLKHHNRLFDYWIGDSADGFETNVQLSSTSPLIVIEGDEYASSPIDSRPKFLHYQPHIALISGIAWDHITLYPTWDEYVDQFESLAEAMPKAGVLIFDESDDMLDVIGQKERTDITKIPYQPHPSEVANGITYLLTKQGKRIGINLFGQHNLKNIAGAILVCDRIGITEDQFYEAIPTFTGVSGRLEKIAANNERIVYWDLAHSPAKVEAITESVRHQHPYKKLMVVLELQVGDGTNPDFLERYKHTVDTADEALVFVDVQLHTSGQDKESELNHFLDAFGRSDLRLFTSTLSLENYLLHENSAAQVFLLMSSASFGDLDLKSISNKLVSKTFV